MKVVWKTLTLKQKSNQVELIKIILAIRYSHLHISSLWNLNHRACWRSSGPYNGSVWTSRWTRKKQVPGVQTSSFKTNAKAGPPYFAVQVSDFLLGWIICFNISPSDQKTSGWLNGRSTELWRQAPGTTHSTRRPLAGCSRIGAPESLKRTKV